MYGDKFPGMAGKADANRGQSFYILVRSYTLWSYSRQYGRADRKPQGRENMGKDKGKDKGKDTKNAPVADSKKEEVVVGEPVTETPVAKAPAYDSKSPDVIAPTAEVKKEKAKKEKAVKPDKLPNGLPTNPMLQSDWLKDQIATGKKLEELAPQLGLDVYTASQRLVMQEASEDTKAKARAGAEGYGFTKVRYEGMANRKIKRDAEKAKADAEKAKATPAAPASPPAVQ